jgi:hypothetical protein
MHRYWCEAHGCGIVALYGNWAYAYYDEATEELVGAATLVDDISIRVDALGGCVVAEVNGGRGFADCDDIEVVCDDDGGF